MSHLVHLVKYKQQIIFRSLIIRYIREYFWLHGFLEVETPLILRVPGQEPNISPMNLDLHTQDGTVYKAFLHTSPEYTMKKMLAAGYSNIFSLCKVFRDYESMGGLHNPEFTMIEWYRVHADMFSLMDDVENLIEFLLEQVELTNLNSHKPHESNFQILNFEKKFLRIHMRDLWKQTLGVDLNLYLEKEQLFQLCIEKGYHPSNSESYEVLFYQIFLNEIEPSLKTMGNVIVHHYPAPMSALSRLSKKYIGYAERFEIYMNGIEIANAFSELTDPQEQLKRLKNEQNERKKIGKDVYDIDMEFIEALETLPQSAGIALGIDRLVQVLIGCQDINDVLPLPMAKIF